MGDELPYKLAGGYEFRGLGAQALKFGLKFPLQGSVSFGAPVRPFPLQSSGYLAASISRSPVAGTSAACYVSPRLAAQRSDNSKLIDGVQKVTSLLAANCGRRVKLLHDAVWSGHDFVVFYRDLKNPEVSQGERLVSLEEFGSSMLGVLAGIFHAQCLDQTSSTLDFAALVGDHLHTGKLTFSQSELLTLSAAPCAEEYTNIIGLTDLLSPST